MGNIFLLVENGKIVMEGEAKEVCDAYVKSSKKK